MTVGGDKLQGELFLEDEIDGIRFEMVDGGFWHDLAILVGEIE